jgi:hypothetical protein
MMFLMTEESISWTAWTSLSPVREVNCILLEEWIITEWTVYSTTIITRWLTCVDDSRHPSELLFRSESVASWYINTAARVIISGNLWLVSKHFPSLLLHCKSHKVCASEHNPPLVTCRSIVHNANVAIKHQHAPSIYKTLQLSIDCTLSSNTRRVPKKHSPACTPLMSRTLIAVCVRVCVSVKKIWKIPLIGILVSESW